MYKLYKRLKECGFPQTGRGGSVVGKLGVDVVYAPSLEEVIEELDNKVFIHCYGTKCCASNALHSEAIRESGKSPLEAVINLYIKLNKDKQL